MAVWSAGSTFASTSRASRARNSKHLSDANSKHSTESQIRPAYDPLVPVPEGALPDEVEEINRLNDVISRRFIDYGLGYKGINLTPEEEKQYDTYSKLQDQVGHESWLRKKELQNQFTYAVDPNDRNDTLSWYYNIPLHNPRLFILKTGMVHNGEKFCIPFAQSIMDKTNDPGKAYFREANRLINKQTFFAPSETYASDEKRQASRERQITEWIKLNQKYFGEDYLTKYPEEKLTPGQYIQDFFQAAENGSVQKLFFNLSPDDQNNWLRDMKNVRFKEEMTDSLNTYAACVPEYHGQSAYDQVNKKYFGECYADYPQEHGLRRNQKAQFLIPHTQEFEEGLHQDFRPPTVRQALPRELDARAQAIKESFRTNPNIPLLKNLRDKQEPIKNESKAERRLPDISNIQCIQDEMQSEF